MSRVVILDTGPLGIATKRRGVPDAEACRQWIATGIRSGASFLVPSIAYFEVRRELERLNNTGGIARLDAFCRAVPDRYLILTDDALRLACTLWARARNAGTPTADPKELDCDVLLAAQVLTLDILPSDVIIATTNVGHLSQFVTADLWVNITF
jgi:predicted nucleic acid-binding protein